MAEYNPLHSLLQNFEKVTNSIQNHFSNLINHRSLPPPTNEKSLLSLSPSLKTQNNPSSTSSDPTHQILIKGTSAAPVAKEELGRATWTFLHTLAAQYPENPTRQQKRDVKELMAILSRLYPCKECADHFKEVLRANPVQTGSHDEFSQWLCHVHNVVNRSLGKLVFPCERVDARWGKLECEQRACDLQGTTIFGDIFK
ncbi:hypothetical protein Ddye_003483 [Dipteronia dyeriana]|uniref:Sulfhydryl oxidase n=1 Tax=Dipteronia dyeriana TaxID=168575 RepID=A0AAD9XSD6_9ROSI|nr:hypothetical protein Ddye_003483 [Dipteronia dyeriana]